MGVYLSLPLLVIVTALEATLLPQVRLLSGQPDVVILLVIAWSVHASLDEAVIWAFVGGLLHDLLSLTPLGTTTLAMLLVIFTLDAIRRQLYSVNIVLVIGFMFAAVVVNHVVFLMVITLTGYRPDLIETIRLVILPSLTYDAALILPIYWLVRRVQNRLTRRQRAR